MRPLPNPDRVKQIGEWPVQLDGMTLPLRRFAGRERAFQSVLLLHGGNTSSELFHWPHGGLVRYLADHHCDVWTFDWRASSMLLGPLIRERGPLFDDVLQERAVFTLDHVAENDFPQALSAMRRAAGVSEEISVLAFCLAGGAMAKAIARGYVEALGVHNVVLATMGLFYEVPWNGWIKSEDFIIERLLASDPRCRSIDPVLPDSWPKALQSDYTCWPTPWLNTEGNRPIDHLFRRLSFCYGDPYARERLEPEFEAMLAKDFFGPIHLGLFLHASQMVRRGYSAKFNMLDVIDRTRISKKSRQVMGTDLLPDHFRNKRVTCITGADDRIWHRDSMDLMYEWLRNECTSPGERQRHRKYIVPRYGHLDIFWGKDAQADVYRRVLSGLTASSFETALDWAAE